MLKRQFEKIKDRLVYCGFLVKDIKEIQYGFQMRVAYGEEEGVIRVFESKKYGVKLDTSLIRGYNLAKKIDICLGNNKTESDLTKLEEEGQFDFYVGSDESGKGDYFGPLVIAGTMVSNENLNRLESLGIKDSKLLKEDRIFYLESEILRLRIPYKRITLLPERYNDLYEAYSSRGCNLNDILTKFHFEVINSFIDDEKRFKVVVDRFSINSGLEEMFKSYKNVKFCEVERSESKFLYVAAASILARAKFLKEMKRLSGEIGFTLKRGSVGVMDLAQKIVDTYGLFGLKKVAKLHFKITRELKS